MRDPRVIRRQSRGRRDMTKKEREEHERSLEGREVFNPYWLQVAMGCRRMSIHGLAKLTKVQVPRAKRWVLGDETPASDHVVLISMGLDFPKGFFFRDTPAGK